MLQLRSGCKNSELTRNEGSAPPDSICRDDGEGFEVSSFCLLLGGSTLHVVHSISSLLVARLLVMMSHLLTYNQS